MHRSTSNALTPSERSRLVRSNRKLQALLGEAPQIIEAAVSEASIHTMATGKPKHQISHSLSSSSSFDIHGTTRPRPNLHLHLDASNQHLHPDRDMLSPPLTPLSPTDSITLNSPFPSPSEKEKVTRRRQHAAKLSRTLGENIAPDLLMPGPRPPSVAAPVPLLRRSASVLGLGRARSTGIRNTGPGTLGRSFSTRNRPADRDADDDLFVLVCAPPTSPSPSPAAWPTRSSSTRTPHRRMMSAASGLRPGPGKVDEQPDSDSDDAESPIPASTTGSAVGYTLPTPLELLTGKRRREKEWSGEWSVAMERVKKELRALR